MSTSNKNLARAIAEDRFHRGLEEFGTFSGFSKLDAEANDRRAEWRREKITGMSDEEISYAQERLDRLLGDCK
jgi:hypothetical protein